MRPRKVFAKQKPVDAMGRWLCCAAITERTKRSYDPALLVQFTGKPELAKVSCPFCGVSFDDVPVMRIAGTKKMAVLELYDLDEGSAVAA